MKKTVMKTPKNIRNGFKLAGLFTLFMMALFVMIGADAGGMAMATTGVAGAVGTRDAAVPGQALDTTQTGAGSVNLLDDSVSSKITEMFPSKVPLNHILRHIGTAQASGVNGTGAYAHRFYQIDSRAISAAVAADYTAASTLTAELTVDNAQMFTKDDTLLPVFSTPTDAQKGYDYTDGAEKPDGDLQLIIVGINYGQNKITVQGTNAKRTTASNELTAFMPDIPTGVKLIRLGTALGELDAQASAWQDLPTDSFNYLQTFGAQFEVTPEQLKHFKEVNWDLGKIKSRTVREMLESQERSILFGKRAYFKDQVDQDRKYTMGGAWGSISNVFTYDPTAGLKKEDYNNMLRQLFANNSGSSERFMFMGSRFATQVLNIQEVDKQSVRPTPVVRYGVTFSGFTNIFGSVNTMLHPTLDLTGHADDAIIIDFANMDLVRWGNMEVTELDLKNSGQRNVIAHFMKEKLSLEVRYPQTHMLVKGVTA